MADIRRLVPIVVLDGAHIAITNAHVVQALVASGVGTAEELEELAELFAPAERQINGDRAMLPVLTPHQLKAVTTALTEVGEGAIAQAAFGDQVPFVELSEGDRQWVLEQIVKVDAARERYRFQDQ